MASPRHDTVRLETKARERIAEVNARTDQIPPTALGVKLPTPLSTPALEWDDLRYFLALARTGSLSGAARVLNTTQPTMGRRLAILEAKLGTQLFRRMPSGLRLTEAAEAILHFATAMDEAALAAERVAAGRDVGVSGNIRVTAPNFFGPHILSAQPLLRRTSHHLGGPQHRRPAGQLGPARG